MNMTKFDALFDRFTTTVFRLETLQSYAVDQEDEDLAAWRAGREQPERSVRTSAWMRRIAITTAVEGKQWMRVRLVRHPLSEYLRFEMGAYIESVAVGEQVRIADSGKHAELGELGPDFWLFDADTDQPFGAIMRYNHDGELVDVEYADDNATVVWCREQRDQALKHAVTLNAYLATGEGGARLPA